MPIPIYVATHTARTFFDRVFGATPLAEVGTSFRAAPSIESNRSKNKRHYDRHLRDIRPGVLADTARDADGFLRSAIQTDTSWAALYSGGFAAQLEGARILEVGAGDGLNALVMAALGADVTCIDISEETPPLVTAAAKALGLTSRVHAMCGDFTDLPFHVPLPFDFVVGKAVLHHLTHEQETRWLAKAAEVLGPGGQARFAEPAVNSQLLDACRWLVSVPGRPSRLNRAAFREYLDADPHPVRDNSSAHYVEQGARFFEHVAIVPVGGLERFERLLPKGAFHRRFRQTALRVERWLPYALQLTLARAQAIVMSSPRHPMR